MLYAYCLRSVSDAPPTDGLTGIDGEEVRAHRIGELVVWVSDLNGPMEVSEGRLRQHERVVREALATATPLPFRFGSVFRSIDALDDAIVARSESFRAALGRVADRMEMVIRIGRGGVIGDPEPATSERPPTGPGRPASGREYLERRRQQLKAREAGRIEAERLLQEVEREVVDLTTATAVFPDRDGRFVGRVACLVRKGDLSAFRARVSRVVQDGRPDMNVLVTGPWAPYSFTND